MHRKLIFLFVSFITYSSYAQVCKSIDTGSCDFSSRAFDSVMRKVFTQYATGKTDAFNLANYAALNPLDNSRFSFNTYLSLSLRSGVSFNAEGSLLNGNIGQLFSSGKLNTNTTLKLQGYFQIFPDKNFLEYDCKNLLGVNEKRRLLLMERDARIAALERSFDRLGHDTFALNLAHQNLRLKLDSTRFHATRLHDSIMYFTNKDSKYADSVSWHLSRIENFQKKQDSIDRSTSSASANIIRREFQLKIDSSRLHIRRLQDSIAGPTDRHVRIADSLTWYMNRMELLQKNRDSIARKIDSFRIVAKHLYASQYNDRSTWITMGYSRVDTINGVAVETNYRNRAKQKICKEYDDLFTEMQEAVPFSGVRLRWFSPVLQYNNKEFRTYKTWRPFADQIKRESLNALNYGFEFSRLRIDSLFRRSSFMNIGLIHKKSNNLEDFSTTTINQETETVSGNVTRVVKREYKAYTDSIESFRLWNLYGNYYQMFGTRRTDAFHVFTDMEFRNNKQNIWNAGVGYAIGFNNAKDTKSILNVELYFKFRDILNERETDNVIWGRTDIGLTFSLPFIPSSSKQ